MRLDFIGVGFPRSGSTWLTFCLYEHPEISIPKFNLLTEINYFPEEYEVMGLKNYEKKFKKCDFNKVVGELSTTIILKKRSARILHKLFPNAKIIIYRRKEKDRAMSDYLTKKHFDLLENISLKDVQVDQKSLIEPWIKEFGKENVFIFDLEKSDKNKQRELNKLYRFLGVSEFTPPSINKDSKQYKKVYKFNTTWKDRKKKIPKTTRIKFLRKIINFVKHNLRKNKKVYYTLKRNFHMDYIFQWINRRL